MPQDYVPGVGYFDRTSGKFVGKTPPGAPPAARSGPRASAPARAAGAGPRAGAAASALAIPRPEAAPPAAATPRPQASAPLTPTPTAGGAAGSEEARRVMERIVASGQPGGALSRETLAPPGATPATPAAPATTALPATLNPGAIPVAYAASTGQLSNALPPELYKQLGDLQAVFGPDSPVKNNTAAAFAAPDMRAGGAASPATPVAAAPSAPFANFEGLEDERRAAFMSAPDSISGMNAVKALYAKRLGLDASSPQVYSMRDLESRMEQAKAGAANPSGYAGGFDIKEPLSPVMENPPMIASGQGPGVSGYQMEGSLLGAAQSGSPRGFSLEGPLTPPLENTPQIVPQGAGPGMAGYQMEKSLVTPQTINAYMQSDAFKDQLVRPSNPLSDQTHIVSAAFGPDAGELSAYAALGLDRPTKPGEAEMLSSPFGTRDGTSKQGATVPLGFRDLASLPPLNLNGVYTPPSDYGWRNPFGAF